MGIYNQLSVQYLIMIPENISIYDIKNKLNENNINLQIRRDKNNNNRYIVLTIITDNDKRLNESEYYKKIKGRHNYEEYCELITTDIDIKLNNEENELLNKLISYFNEIPKNNWYIINNISTTYGDYYYLTLEYQIMLNASIEINIINDIIKEICNKNNYPICDIIKCKYTDNIYIRLVNDYELCERKKNSNWLKQISSEYKEYKKQVETDIELTEIEKLILNVL